MYINWKINKKLEFVCACVKYSLTLLLLHLHHFLLPLIKGRDVFFTGDRGISPSLGFSRLQTAQDNFQGTAELFKNKSKRILYTERVMKMLVAVKCQRFTAPVSAWQSLVH